MNLDFTKVLDNATPLLFDGIRITIYISILSIIVGVVIGLLSCLMGMSKNPVLKAISKVYIWIIRGTPMIVQAIFVFYGVPQFVRLFVGKFNISPFMAGLITLSLNAGAYLAEIFRGGIMAVPKGQVEAARSLGLSSVRTMLKVVLPQAFKIALPSMVNQFIITIKDTSILSVIGLAEITNRANTYVGSTYRYFETYIFVAIYYLVVISILMILSNYLEKKINYEKKGNS